MCVCEGGGGGSFTKKHTLLVPVEWTIWLPGPILKALHFPLPSKTDRHDMIMNDESGV